MNTMIKAFSNEMNPEIALTAIRDQFKGTNLQDHIILFISSEYDLVEIEKLIPIIFETSNVHATTTAGEIYDGHFYEKSIAGILLKKSNQFDFCSLNIEDLNADIESEIKSFKETASYCEKILSKTLGLLFIDGLSKKEEMLMSILGSNFPTLPIIGGSAGDALHFRETKILINGKFKSNAAQVFFISTDLNFEIIKLQNYKAGDESFVVTDSDQKYRVVKEIEGEVAAEFYANQIGVKSSELNSEHFSLHPIIVTIGGHDYARSIQSIGKNGELQMYCAIETGMIISLGKTGGMIKSLDSIRQKYLSKSHTEIFTVFFECILRRLEILSMSEEEQDQIYKIYSELNAIGYHTYGEQINSLHINQTLTGVIFYE